VLYIETDRGPWVQALLAASRMDQWGRDAPLMKKSTLNRADLLTLFPVLRCSLGSSENRLSFRELIDSHDLRCKRCSGGRLARPRRR
jgi:hypothetical protein